MRLAEAAKKWWTHVQYGSEQDLGPFSVDPEHANRPVNWLVRVIGARKFVFVHENHGVALRDPPIKFGKFLTGQMKEKKRPPRVITPREAVVLKNAERPDLTPLREFAVLTTLRLDECLITWPQVDFATRKIRLIQKGGEAREVDITPAIERLLRPLKGHHETHIFTWKAQRTRTDRWGNKFVKGQRYPWTYWGVSSARRRDWPKAGVKANFHDLRRTGAEYMRAAGVPIDIYSKQLGHADIATTEIYMGDLSPEQLAAAALKRDAWLEAVMAKAEAELADEAAAADAQQPTKNPTIVVRMQRKELKSR